MSVDARPKVAVGMSGGVDSAVAALLLKEQGYDVFGIFMKNWDEKDEAGECTAAEDYDDARAVCAKIGIPLAAVSFQEQYWDRVFEHFLSEYRAGRTPNPDVLCNKEIKFGAFLDYTADLGADLLATGHYARLDKSDGVKLLKGADPNKDQTYFLCMLTADKLERAVFPVGHLLKEGVRRIAAENDLPVAKKKDSTGVCFIGERKFKQFLQTFIPAQRGEMRTPDGRVVGEHDGLMFYTIGQRRGLGIGGAGNGDRWFVIGKDMERNVLIVEQGEDSGALYSTALATEPAGFIAGSPPVERFRCGVKTRYRQPDQDAEVTVGADGCCLIEFSRPQRAVTPGQYAVMYLGDWCIGGAVIKNALT